MKPLDVVAGTGEPAFVVNVQGCLVAWNRGAQQLLGHSAAEVLGRPCYEVLRGFDVFGNRHCQKFCALRVMALQGEPISRCCLRVRSAAGGGIMVDVDCLVLPQGAARERLVVHILHRSPEKQLPSYARGHYDESSLGPAEAAPAGCSLLTTKETDILRLLSGGASTREIARSLSISPATVRNHIYHILGKLHAHSRLEAVCLARRRRLL
jgi:DNA-binding CsgD family transcriptional regulator